MIITPHMLEGCFFLAGVAGGFDCFFSGCLDFVGRVRLVE